MHISLLLSFTQLPPNVTAVLFSFIYQGKLLLSVVFWALLYLTFRELHKFALRAHYKQSAILVSMKLKEKVDVGCFAK